MKRCVSANYLADRQTPKGQRMWAPEEEGIAFPGSPTAYPRVGDDLVVKQAKARKRLAKRRFKDAGLLMMDVRHSPMLVVCAGHGGAGTLGCVRQLRDRASIEDLVEASRLEKRTRGRFVAVVEVNRERPAGSEDGFSVDDLEIVSNPIVWASVTVPGRVWR